MLGTFGFGVAVMEFKAYVGQPRSTVDYAFEVQRWKYNSYLTRPRQKVMI